jgi:hypothetical protein
MSARICLLECGMLVLWRGGGGVRLVGFEGWDRFGPFF